MRRPFVTLIVEPNPKNINQMVPEFRITGYSDHDVDLPGFEPSSPKNAATTNGAAPSDSNGARSSMRASDMDNQFDPILGASNALLRLQF